jgi:hypothetical protein
VYCQSSKTDTQTKLSLKNGREIFSFFFEKNKKGQSLAVTWTPITYYTTQINSKTENTAQREGSFLQCWFFYPMNVFMIINITIIPY